MPSFTLRRACLATCFVVLGAAPALSRASEAPAEWVAPADTSSPRAMLESFLSGCNEVFQVIKNQRFVDRDDTRYRPLAQRVRDCLDDSQLPDFARDYAVAEAAICIKEILDRVELPPTDETPGDEAVEAGGLERWRIPGTRLVIVKITEGPRKHEYVFSSGTVRRSFEYFKDVKAIPYRTSGPTTTPGFHEWYVTAPANATIAGIVDRLPESMRARVFGVARWKWIGLVLASLFCGGLMVSLYWLQRRLAARWGTRRPLLYAATLIAPALAVLVPRLYAHLATSTFSLRGEVLYVVSFTASLLTLLACVALVVAGIDRLANLLIAMPHINPQGLDAQFIRIVSRLLSISAALVLLLEGGQYLGIPLTTLLASAGVGGLAVALAAQDTLRNLFGTIMLMADKPFRVGERIVADGHDGVVEDIGLRSTRIRLLTGHLVTIPNDTLAKIDIENIGRRPFIRRVADLRVPLDTPRAALDEALDAIRTELADHEGMSPEFPPRVYFNELNDDSFNVRLMYWYHPADYWAYSAFSERLNLRVVEELERRGITLLRPLRVGRTETGAPDAPVRVELVGGAATS